MPLIDLFVMEEISADKTCADLLIESVRGMIALFGVDNVRLVQTAITKERFQLFEKPGRKVLTAEPGIYCDHQKLCLRLVISYGVWSFCGVAAINEPAQKGGGKEPEIRNSEELQLKKEGEMMNALHVECADNGPAQRPFFVNGGEADSSRTFRDVSIVKGTEMVT